MSLAELGRRLATIDGRGYGAYRSIKGRYRGDGFELIVDHVQSDPFASPSRLRLRVPRATHAIPDELGDGPVRGMALADLLLRTFRNAVWDLPRTPGSGRSGRVEVDAGGAEVLARAGCEVASEHIEIRFRVGLPARGRTVLGRAAAELLTRHLPAAAERLRWDRLDQDRAWAHVRMVEDHARLQALLADHGLVAFVRDGSRLPRESGASSFPMDDPVPFESPGELRVTLPTLHHGEVTGMGLPAGVTLITGGGFHGKTTLLSALALGVYPHVPGDGREWVVTRADAVKVRSEDGRAVTGVDLSPFIRDLPGGRDTSWFETADASGSTSLAAAILEAVELGSRCLLLDEDTCATNLLVRDARMRDLVTRETITPLVDRVRALHDELGVSTVLVLGGSGEYLDVADRVLLLSEYRTLDATVRAGEVATEHPLPRSPGDEGAAPLALRPRAALARSFDPRRGRRDKVKARGLRELVFGEETIDLSALEQLVDDSQARAIGVLLKHLRTVAEAGLTLQEALGRVHRTASDRGLYSLDPVPELAMPRLLELGAAVNRLRSLVVVPPEPSEGDPG